MILLHTFSVRVLDMQAYKYKRVFEQLRLYIKYVHHSVCRKEHGRNINTILVTTSVTLAPTSLQ